MLVNYIDVYIGLNNKVNKATEKQQIKLTRKIVKLGQWASEDLRRFKECK